MSTLENQKLAANYMGAIAHALGGSPGRHREFIDKVELLLSGSEPDAMQLMRFTGAVRETGRPVIWIHHMADAPTVPLIGLVAEAAGKVHVIENCMLWMPARSGPIRLVPDNFLMGAFHFDGELRMQHSAKAPAASFEAAQPGMLRAYERVIRLEAMQRDRGDVFDLPSHVPFQQAA